MEEVKKIQEILEKSGLSREEVAKKVGVSSKTLGSWVRGKSAPKGKNNERIRRVYNEIFGKKASEKKAKEAERKKLDEMGKVGVKDILLSGETVIREEVIHDEDDDGKRKYYDGKMVALTLEKENRDKLILFRSIETKNSEPDEWYKMGGNSLLFYVYVVAPRLKKQPKIRKDTDMRYRFREGVVSVHWKDNFVKNMEKLGLVAREGDLGMIIVDLGQTFSLSEIKTMREQAQTDRKKFQEMLMPKENFPDIYGQIRKLAQLLVPKVGHLKKRYQEVFGDRLIRRIMDLFEAYFRIANGENTKAEGYREMKILIDDIKGLIVLSDEVNWFEFTTRSRVGETLVDLNVTVERRLNNATD